MLLIARNFSILVVIFATCNAVLLLIASNFFPF
jgi:hypothetical protein